MFGVPSTAEAKWRDNSDNLPGLKRFPYELVAIGAVVITGVTYFAIKKRSDRNKQSEEAGQNDETPATEDAGSSESHETEDTTREINRISRDRGEDSRWGFYLGVDQSVARSDLSLQENRADFTDLTVKAGFSFSF